MIESPLAPPSDEDDEGNEAQPGLYEDLSRHATGLARLVTGHAARAAGAGRELLGEAGARARGMLAVEDPDVIVASPSFRPFPHGGPAPELLSVAWQSDALVGLSAVGVVAWEREIVTVT